MAHDSYTDAEVEAAEAKKAEAKKAAEERAAEQQASAEELEILAEDTAAAEEAHTEEVHDQYKEYQTDAMKDGLDAAVAADEAIKESGQPGRESLTENVFPESGEGGAGPAKNVQDAPAYSGMYGPESGNK